MTSITWFSTFSRPLKCESSRSFRTLLNIGILMQHAPLWICPPPFILISALFRGSVLYMLHKMPKASATNDFFSPSSTRSMMSSLVPKYRSFRSFASMQPDERKKRMPVATAHSSHRRWHFVGIIHGRQDGEFSKQHSFVAPLGIMQLGRWICYILSYWLQRLPKWEFYRYWYVYWSLTYTGPSKAWSFKTSWNMYQDLLCCNSAWMKHLKAALLQLLVSWQLWQAVGPVTFPTRSAKKKILKKHFTRFQGVFFAKGMPPDFNSYAHISLAHIKLKSIQLYKSIVNIMFILPGVSASFSLPHHLSFSPLAL